MKKDVKRRLLEATGCIRDAFIEEAAAQSPKRLPLWTKFAAAAALLALIFGVLSLWPARVDPDTGETVGGVGFMTVRVYAADGTESTLSSVGDTGFMAAEESALFPDRQVFVLDVSLLDANGNRLELAGSEFRCYHNYFSYLLPGECDEKVSVQWIEEPDFYGYRIIGWCDQMMYLDIRIRGENGWYLHQQKIRIAFDGEYSSHVTYSYTYEPELPTEQLIEKIFSEEQDYSRDGMLSSSIVTDYSSYLYGYGGFAELEQRADAADLLFERWLEEMKKPSVTSRVSVDSSGLVGNVLAQDVYWNQLSDAQLALIESYGMRRYFTEPYRYEPFPGKETFTYELIIPGGSWQNHLDISWPGMEEGACEEHFTTAWISSHASEREPYSGWKLWGWFDEETLVALTVTDPDGNRITQVILRVTPTEDGYTIEELAE